MAALSERLDYRDAMRVDLPAGVSGPVEVRHFIVTEEKANFERLRAVFNEGRGWTPPGRYTMLLREGVLWMSDTRDEMRDHVEPFLEARRRGGRVLINGLGLGMVVQACLLLPDVEHVDVVELDEDVIRLVEPTLAARFPGRLTVHHADAYEQMRAWPAGSRWSVAWHDIWPDINSDNLPAMTRLHRSYGRRVDWQGSWARWYAERPGR